jgi:hypothetical protein
MRDVLLREKQLDLLQPFAKALVRLAWRDAETAKLVRQEGARKADVEAAVRDRIQHSDLARELERMIEHRQHGAGDQTHACCALRGGGQEQQRAGAVAAVMVEIMLHRTDMGEAQLVGFLGKIERLGKVLRGGLLVRANVREELDSEFHGSPRQVRRREPALRR